MGWMKRNSANCQQEDTPPTHKVSGPVTDADCWATGVKWHHGAGHSSGRGVYYFWASTAEETAAVEALIAKVKKRKEEKRKRTFPSKAAAWRHITATKDQRQQCAGFGHLDIKHGKYGLFVSSYGEPDFRYYFADEKEAADIRTALEI